MNTPKDEMPAGAALSPYDTAEFLRTPEHIAAYLEVVFEDYGNDPAMIAKALGNAARAQGMKKIAKETGLNREGLYQALSGKGNPSFDTVLKVMNAVGVELRPKAVTRRRVDLKAKAGRKRRTSGVIKKTRPQSSSTKARRSK